MLDLQERRAEEKGEWLEREKALQLQRAARSMTTTKEEGTPTSGTEMKVTGTQTNQRINVEASS